MKKHRKLFRNCFLAILCIGLVFVGGYTYSNAGNCGCRSVLIDDGDWQPKVTSVTYDASKGKYKVVVNIKTGGTADADGNWLKGYAWNPNSAQPGNFRIGFASAVTEWGGASYAYAPSGTLTTNYRVYAKATDYTEVATYSIMRGKTGDSKKLYETWYDTETRNGIVTLTVYVDKAYKYLVVSSSTSGDWVNFDPHGNANTHKTANESGSNAYAIIARSGDISGKFHTHSWKWVTDKNPTCTQKGKKHQKCTGCSATRNSNTAIAALGHITPADWTIDNSIGYHYKNCSRGGCGVRLVTEPNTYTIRYTAPSPNGATVGGSVADTAATYDQNVSLRGTGFTLTGYHCNSNWITWDNKSLPTTVKNLTAVHGGLIILHHTWAPNTYSVQFNSTKPAYATASTGAASAYKQPYTYDSAQALTANAYAYSGATFLGWSTTNGGTKVYNNQQNVSNLTATDNATVNLFAVWKPIQYYVRYNRNMPDASGLVSVTKGPLNYGTSYTALTQSGSGMSRDGYYIAYWTTNADGTGTRYYAGDKDWPAGSNSVNAQFKDLTKTDGATVDLYAHWEPIKYTLIYSKNDSKDGVNPAGQSNDTYTETHYYNETFNLAKNNWTRVNELNVPSVFRGWNLLSDCNNTDSRVKYAAKWGDVGSFINGDTNKLCLTRDGSITICTVWDDVPVVKATDYELPYNDVTGRESVPDLTNETSDAALSKTRLEEILLARAVTAHGDREDGELPIGKNFRIEYFSKPSFATVDHPTCYEIKYTVEDNTGNTYTQSAMLYAGYLVRIDVQ